MGASSTAASGFGILKKESSKEELLVLCIEKVHVMRLAPITKKRYVGMTNCIPIYSKLQHLKRVQLERKYLAKKDEVVDQVKIAKQILQSMGSGGVQLQKMNSSVAASDAGSADENLSQFSLANLTFKDLIDHVNVIENNYTALSTLIQNNPMP